jgi:probable DNA metabolism protein
MYRVHIQQPDDLDAFRDAVRRLLAAQAPPDEVLWSSGASGELFGEAPPPAAKPVLVPAAFGRLAEDVVCHADPARFALLYQALWRIMEGERALLGIGSDPLVHRLQRMQKAVARDSHKMTAFVRFRCVATEQGEHYVAWYEPEHHVLRRVAPFFVDRFPAMRWSILTPQGSLHWAGTEVAFGPGVSREQAPSHDAIEAWWRTYYGSVFNPARLNTAAMRSEMPKKFWRNLPEAGLIPALVAQAGERTREMLDLAPTVPRKRVPVRPVERPAAPETLAQVAVLASVCERCALFRDATQTVFGEGPADAPVVFVGEQPGDQEDLAGRPFVGPAGLLLNQALAQAGIDRGRVYVTNAVKHFKFEPRGRRRIHKKPDAGEIEQCRWLLDQELELIRPRLTVALGASAARALTGRAVGIERERGRVQAFRHGPGLVTVHPSYLLRLTDPDAKTREYERFVRDLAGIGNEIPAIRRAA